jgi:hypothetical protein
MEKRPVFIIAHKYFRGYPSYLRYYIDNILNFYKNSLILVVDNNSEFKEDIFSTIETKDNIVLLNNNIDCKFELGAYIVGFKYLIERNKLSEFDYVFCTQDNYIIKKKYDINILKNNNIKAASIINLQNDYQKGDVVIPVLERLGMMNKLELSFICWCNSFILSIDKLPQFYEYIKDIVISTRHESEASERYLGRLLLEINNDINFSIDGNNNTFFVNGIGYDCHHINIYEEIDKYFCKISQQKNENTINR